MNILAHLSFIISLQILLHLLSNNPINLQHTHVLFLIITLYFLLFLFSILMITYAYYIFRYFFKIDGLYHQEDFQRKITSIINAIVYLGCNQKHSNNMNLVSLLRINLLIYYQYITSIAASKKHIMLMFFLRVISLLHPNHLQSLHILIIILTLVMQYIYNNTLQILF